MNEGRVQARRVLRSEARNLNQRLLPVSVGPHPKSENLRAPGSSPSNSQGSGDGDTCFPQTPRGAVSQPTGYGTGELSMGSMARAPPPQPALTCPSGAGPDPHDLGDGRGTVPSEPNAPFREGSQGLRSGPTIRKLNRGRCLNHPL